MLLKCLLKNFLTGCTFKVDLNLLRKILVNFGVFAGKQAKQSEQ
jgi:hypothetical protein